MVESEPFRFHFFQAVRLLERISPDRESVGNFSRPDREVVRFGAHQTTSFPASEIQALSFPDGRQPQMSVNFMGLTGAQGVLALWYTDYVMQRMRAKDHAPREFFDIFNHRAISLFYRAWEKYRFGIAYERGEPDSMSKQLMALVGLGTQGMEGRAFHVPGSAFHDGAQQTSNEKRGTPSDGPLLYFAGLFSQQPRSAGALQQIVSDYFNVPVEIEQFAGRWYRLERNSQTRLDESDSYTEALGIGTVVGDEVWDQQSVVRIRVGPLPLDRYLEFLPTGNAWQPLRSLVRFYFNDQLDFELQLVLRREEAPRCELGNETPEAPRLGWVTWMKTAPLGRDPGDTVLQL
jgi:type VI secretion system protein ImpH